MSSQYVHPKWLVSDKFAQIHLRQRMNWSFIPLLTVSCSALKTAQFRKSKLFHSWVKYLHSQ